MNTIPSPGKEEIAMMAFGTLVSMSLLRRHFPLDKSGTLMDAQARR